VVEETIKLWQREYKETYEKFLDLLFKNYNLKIDSFLKGIYQYNKDLLDIFSQLYPNLTSGASFDFYGDNDIVTIFQDIVKKLKGYGYRGIYVVVDEFNKFLEKAVKNKKHIDLKVLQDLAEMCNRSEDDQIHIMLISHQHLTQYADKLSEDVVNEWKKIEGRFKTIELSSNSSKTYHLISKVIHKDERIWNDFIENNQDKFNQLVEKVSFFGLFNELTEVEIKDWVLYGCYPIHPTTVFALPKISSQLAQNDRTLFTFLSTNEFNTLGKFLEENDEKDFNLLTLDKIYDYFSDLMKKQDNQTTIFKIWLEVEGALKKIKETNGLQSKIVKILGILSLLCEYQKLPPTVNSLYLSLSNYTEDLIDEALKSLQREKIIYLRKSDGIIHFFQNSDVNFEEEIEKVLVSSKYQNYLSLSKILNDNFMFYPVIAKRYNDTYEMTRYFIQMFFTFDELCKGVNWDNLIIELGYVDGIIVNIICERKEQLEQSEVLIKKIQHPQLLFVTSKEPLDLREGVFKYQALKILQQDQDFINKTPLVSVELEAYLDDFTNIIEMELMKLSVPSVANYYYLGEKENINTKAKLSKFVSKICYSVFSKTPKINNELINKNNISANIKSARKKVIKALYSNNNKPYLGLKGYGPDVSIFRSVIKRTGIYRYEKGVIELSLPQEENLKSLLVEMKQKILKAAENEQSFNELYIMLKEKPYGIRDGIIPLIFALSLRELKDYLVIKANGIEEPISPELFESIIKNPKEYTFHIVAWDNAKEKFVTAVREIFADYIDSDDLLANKLYPVGIGMKNWFISLPIFTRETKRVSPAANNLKRVLKSQSLNSKELLFNRIPKMVVGCSDENIDYEELLILVKEGKEELENHLAFMKDFLIKEVKEIFNSKNDRESLCSVVKNWYEDLSNKVKNHIFEGATNIFIDIGQNQYFNDIALIEDCCRKITGLRIEDWSDDTVDNFLSTIKYIKEDVEKFDKEEESKNKLITIIKETESGEKIEKTFERGEISSLGEILLNDLNSSLESFADAISTNEKRQILIHLLEKLI
jgi:hypothetical protein